MAMTHVSAERSLLREFLQRELRVQGIEVIAVMTHTDLPTDTRTYLARVEWRGEKDPGNMWRSWVEHDVYFPTDTAPDEALKLILVSARLAGCSFTSRPNG